MPILWNDDLCLRCVGKQAHSAQFFEAAGNAAKSRQFTGKEHDAESGLDYFGVRYYGSALGRFTSPDPLMASAKTRRPQTVNRYSYVSNNPLRFVDDDGRLERDAGGKLVFTPIGPPQTIGTMDDFHGSIRVLEVNRPSVENMLKRFIIYATRQDWLPLLGELEASIEVLYARRLYDVHSELVIWEHAKDIPNFGIARGTDTNRCESFQISHNAESAARGHVAILNPGGQFNAATIIQGTITTVFEDYEIQRIMRKLKSLMTKQFSRVGVFWVGSDALSQLRSGARLTINIDAAPEFDLRE